MDTAVKSADSNNGRSRIPRVRGWVVIIAAFAFGAGYLYYIFIKDQEVFVNSYYSRTLQEVAAEFNNKLMQLVTLHDYCESKSTIESIFASYQAGGRVAKDDTATPGKRCGPYRYSLETNRLTVTETPTGEVFVVDIEDLLPQPQNDFVLYVIVDATNLVRSSSASLSGFSMIDTGVISRAIQARDNQDWTTLATRQGGDSADYEKPLPGYSTHIDVELNIGKSRVFVLPFVLHHSIGIPNRNGDSSDRAQSGGGVALYLIGIQPESVVDAYGSKRWNVSLLLLSLVGLIFVWTITRLLMLSRHEPIGGVFYGTTLLSSCFTYILLVAMLLALVERTASIAYKHQRARILMEEVQRGTEQDLSRIFADLEKYQEFYSELLACSLKDSARASQWKRESASIRSTGGVAGTSPGTSSMSIHQILVGPGETLEYQSAVGADLASFLCASPDVEVFSKLSIYGPGTTLNVGESEGSDLSEWFDTESPSSQPGGGRILSTFLMDKDGWQVMPSFFYYETNKWPTSYHLAHRDYFRHVRDRTGWHFSPEHFTPGEGIGASAAAGTPSSDEGEIAPESEQQEQYPVSNYYIQRLLNINTGTRGSTLAMPLLRRHEDAGERTMEADYILGADIVLPSLSLTAWKGQDTVQDMVFMVVDRVSGQVLYHMDADRSMVENLYQSGRGAAAISRVVAAGQHGGRAVRGYYHGESGDFLSASLPVSQWALVVFAPDSSSDSIMTNVFLADAGGMLATLVSVALLLYLLRSRFDSEALKSRWSIPASINRHSLLLSGSVLIASIYLGFRLGRVIGGYLNSTSPAHYAVYTGLLALAVVLALAYGVLWYLRRGSGQGAHGTGRAGAAEAVLLIPLLLLGFAVTGYLWHLGDRSGEALSDYYRSLYEARLNQEKFELHQFALTRFPNTIRLHGGDPLGLVPIDQQWRSMLSDPCTTLPGGVRKYRPPHVTPENLGTFSQYAASTNPYEWLLHYLLNRGPDSPEKKCSSGEASGGGDLAWEISGYSTASPESQPNIAALSRFVTAVVLAFCLLCSLWFLLYRRLLSARLLGPPGLMEHLRHMARRESAECESGLNSGLLLDLDHRATDGDQLDTLLFRARESAHAENGPPARSGKSPINGDAVDIAGSRGPNAAMGNNRPETNGDGAKRSASARGMALLSAHCPWLTLEDFDSDRLPGMKLSFSYRAGKPGGDPGERELELCLSDLSICLSQAAPRSLLLRLIRLLKAMQLDGELSQLRICVDFHSYESLLLKAHTIASDRDPMRESEFAEWADTLMDFTVLLPEALTRNVDRCLLRYECHGSHLLNDLSAELMQNDREVPGPDWRQQRRWLSLLDVHKRGSEWATLNLVLLKAGALYRHRWEDCSSAEKLALYYLAKKRRINTANARLLEQLALKGLIRVDYGRIRIVNNSFAYFARHAEDTSTLRKLVEVGDGGVWQEYRLPVTLVILLILGAIALTSGSSLYVIVASMLGLLGTIGSLTNSARMIRENLR